MGRLALAFLAIATVFGGSACRRSASSSSTTAPAANGREVSELKMTAMHVQSYSESGLEWEMNAPFGEVFTHKNIMRVKDMSVQLYENGTKSSDVSAMRGIMSTGPKVESKTPVGGPTAADVSLDQGDMYLDGNVVMISTDGSKLLTDWAHYHKKTNLITSKAPVRVERKDSITTGIGMEASADMSHVHIFNETLTIPEQPGEKL